MGESAKEFEDADDEHWAVAVRREPVIRRLAGLKSLDNATMRSACLELSLG